MTVHRSWGRGDPSGRSRTARRCCSNCPVTAPSIDQWPELCGRIASSLTTKAGSSRPSHLEQLDGEHPGDVELAGHAQRRVHGIRRQAGVQPGAGASTSVQMPSVCTVSTTGQAAAWPEGLRATSTASSRRNGTRSSRSRPVPSAAARSSQSASSSADAATRTPLPS